MRKLLAALACAGLLGGFASAAQAQAKTDWPKQPLHLNIAFAPGGPVDIIARIIGPKLTEILGQSMVIENKPGAGGNIGTAFVARSAPDGYNVLVTSSAYAVNVSLFANPGYDPEKDLIPVAVVASQANMLVVNSSLPVKNLKELVAYAKGKKLAFATPGQGTTPHLTGENVYNLQLKLGMTAIHYKGAGPATAAVAGNEPSFGSMALAAPLPFVKSGRLRALGISSAKRVPYLPDVPTLTEQGYPIEDYTWVGVFVPVGTPAAVVSKLSDAINKAIAAPEVKEHMAVQAFEPEGGTPQKFAEYVKTEIVKWGKVVKETGAKAD
ncbi:MAG TPA: tripartite tricarboxylate transporter substrate binding protein [Burkholderiales bacterium]|jgi:tripartite-type tricarboxylate transporter receptor subunit TctC|nr:tripartite tricarboxylate transporter substrate binding protein [Burkholderiales bacterium]